MYSYDDLFLFAKVVEVGSFIHTARLLKISHTTISRRMKTLEDRLGLTLMRVNVKNLELTDIGQQVYDAIKDKADDIDSRIEHLIAIQKEPHGDLLVQLPIAITIDKISKHLPEFCRRYPNINLNISYQNNEVDLVKHGIDVAILNTVPRQQNVKIKKLYNAYIKMYCTKQYAEKYGLPQKPEDLTEHIVIGHLMDDYSNPNHVVVTNIKNGTEVIIDMPRRITSNSSLHNLSMLYSNEVIATVMDATAANINSDNIINVLPDHQLLSINFYLVRHPHGNDIRIKSFCDFLEECLHM